MGQRKNLDFRAGGKKFTNVLYLMQYAFSTAEPSSMQPAACMSNINLECRLAPLESFFNGVWEVAHLNPVGTQDFSLPHAHDKLAIPVQQAQNSTSLISS